MRESRSFQLKMAVLSALLSGLVLVGFNRYFLFAIYQGELKRVDREILSLGEARLRSCLHDHQGDDFEQSLRFIYGEQPQRHIVIKVFDRTAMKYTVHLRGRQSW